MIRLVTLWFSIIFISLFISIHTDETNELFQYLMLNYNKDVRPVKSNSDIVIVKLGLKLIQIADVNEKNQIMQTHVYVLHEWHDASFVWSPEDFGGMEFIQIPNDLIWKPDIVLYNNADGDYQIISGSKAQIRYDGTVYWNPPMIYKSYCGIDIQYYPFDIQNCTLKFGLWTYYGSLVNLQFLTTNQSSVIERGWDLEDYTPSIEWEILNLRAIRHEKVYACCAEVYLDLTFTCQIQRKSLFYIVSLIIPCVNISILTGLVFLQPSDSRKKITLSISILVALLVFYLLLIELIPPTSIVVPLFGKYLLFTLVLVNLSIIITIATLNTHFRRQSPLDMTPWLRKILLNYLPNILMMKRPNIPRRYFYPTMNFNPRYQWRCEQRRKIIEDVADHISYIAEQIENVKHEKEIIEEWRFIALILDRLLLIIFILVNFFGTLTLLLQVPTSSNSRLPVNPYCYSYYPPLNDSNWIKECEPTSSPNKSNRYFFSDLFSLKKSI